MFKIEFHNLGENIRKLQNVNGQLTRSITRELYEQGETVITTAKEEAPVDLGIMRASGHVLPPKVEGGHVSITLGFGGPAGTGNQGGQTNNEDVGYAEIVHEDLDAKHAVGNAKYLENPLRSAQPAIGKGLEGAVEDAAKKVGLN